MLFLITTIFNCINPYNLPSTARSYSNEDLILTNCYFQRSNVCDYSGGVIYIYNTVNNLKLYFVSFFECGSKLHGGAIYFDSTSSLEFHIILRNCLAHKCTCTLNYGSARDGHFCYLYTRNNILYTNSIECSSISSCSNITDLGYSSTYLYNGNQSIISVNSSNNNAQRYSSFYFLYPNDFQLKFCYISMNVVTSFICLRYQGFSVDKIFSYTNFIGNNNIASSYSNIYLSSATLTITNSIFTQNTHRLFSHATGSYLTISECIIDHESSMMFSGTRITLGYNIQTTNFNPTTIEIISYCLTQVSIQTPYQTIIQTNSQKSYEKFSFLLLFFLIIF